MFHASVLEPRKNYQIILGKRIRNSRISFHPVQGIQDLTGNFRTLAFAGRIGLPMINGN